MRIYEIEGASGPLPKVRISVHEVTRETKTHWYAGKKRFRKSNPWISESQAACGMKVKQLKQSRIDKAQQELDEAYDFDDVLVRHVNCEIH